MNKANQQELFPVCNKGLTDYLISIGEFMIFCNCGKIKYGTAYSAHMRVNDSVSADEVEKILSISE